MSTDAPTTPPPPPPPAGYLSEESKRRFTLMAGVMGTVFFLAQMVLPMVVMFAFMMPMMFARDFKQVDVDGAALWHGDLWLTEESTAMSGSHEETTSLQRLRTGDLEPAGPAVPIGEASTSASHALLPIGERLWVVGTDAVRYYDGSAVVRLQGQGRPDRASRPFAHGGRPAVLVFGFPTTLSTLEVSGSQATWIPLELDLRLPQEAGMVHALQALEVDGRLLLFAQLCVESEKCAIHYRALDASEWRLATDQAAGGDWSVVLRGSQPAVVTAQREKEQPRGRKTRYTIVTLGSEPRRETVELQSSTIAWKDWRALGADGRLLLLTRRFGGHVRLDEVVDGRVVRTATRDQDPFPFGPGMMALMVIPQLVPVVLSLVMAYLLTTQMRQHRVTEYVYAGEQRTFASLWQRALAQAVDAVPFAVSFVLPVLGFWRMFSDPEGMVAESGERFFLWFFGGIAAAFVASLVLMLAYSYLEGRFGKTPGKWLVGIRVLGTDLQPCGFGRAFLRNLLTFVDGFFNFLVGALMVAFTENWQRLGDFAARTVVLADHKA